MALQLATEVDYRGMTGIDYLRFLHHDLNVALRHSDWDRIRFLDKACAVLVDKVIAANKNDPKGLVVALNELKNVYKNMIVQCKYEVNSIAR